MMTTEQNFSVSTGCPETLSVEEMKDVQTIEWWFDSVLHIAISVVGLIANLISIPVLLSNRLTNVFYRTLAFLAVFDFVFIACDVLESLRRGYGYNMCTEMPIHQIIHTYLFPKFLRPLQNITMVASIYTTVVVTLGRYFAVSKPISTMINSGTGCWKQVMAYVMPVVGFAVVFKLPIFFEFYTKWCYSFCVDGTSTNGSYCDNDVNINQIAYSSFESNTTLGTYVF